MIDYHNHTKLCKHAEGEIFEYIEKAISLGISEIAFTDHIPLPDGFDLAHRMKQSEMESYSTLIQKTQQKYPEIKILFGIEAEYYEGFEKFTENFLKQYDFDIVIMSVHFIKEWSDGNWVFNYDFAYKSIKEIYLEYLKSIKKGIDTGLFDVVAHIDIIKKPGLSIMKLVPEAASDILSNIKKSQMVLEINTSGFRRKIAEPYPGNDWFETISELQVPVCIGSDSHAPDQVGLGFNSIYTLLQNKNIKQIAHFDKRNFILKPISNILNNNKNKT